MNINKKGDELVKILSQKAVKMAGTRLNEIERFCWMVVHEERHGAMPVEYDIREIDEKLYLDVLNHAKENI